MPGCSRWMAAIKMTSAQTDSPLQSRCMTEISVSRFLSRDLYHSDCPRLSCIGRTGAREGLLYSSASAAFAQLSVWEPARICRSPPTSATRSWATIAFGSCPFRRPQLRRKKPVVAPDRFSHRQRCDRKPLVTDERFSSASVGIAVSLVIDDRTIVLLFSGLR